MCSATMSLRTMAAASSLEGSPSQSLAAAVIHSGGLCIDLVHAHEPEEAAVAAVAAEIAHREDLPHGHANRRDVGAAAITKLERRLRIARRAVDEDVAVAHFEEIAADSDDALDEARPAIGRVEDDDVAARRCFAARDLH